MQMKDVLGLILGGGAGTRLHPLTKERAKPAVPLAGKYRLIDIPMSNCLNSGIDKIAILTQFNSVSLHRHIWNTYHRDKFASGWVQVLAAEQTFEHKDWYQGTADAVRKQLIEIKEAATKYVLILAGDHLYRMDYRRFVEYHVETQADVTLAVQPVGADVVSGLGVLKREGDGRISRFVEKPKDPALLDDLKSSDDPEKPFVASMGIYVFETEVLIDLLNQPGDDFGKDIIPAAMEQKRVMGYVFDGYWEDIGTIARFFKVNLDMANIDAPFDFYSAVSPIYTHARYLPASEVHDSRLNDVLLTDGCRVLSSQINNAVIGLRSHIGPDVTIQEAVIMGADFYETEEELAKNAAREIPPIGIGAGSNIRRALIDKNARIGKNVTIRAIDDREDQDHDNWVSRDGIVIVPKNACIPDNTVI